MTSEHSAPLDRQREGELAEADVCAGAGTYYILAERFDEDPFLIFAWRGREKDELIARLRAQRGAGGRRTRDATTPAQPEPRQTSPEHAERRALE